MDEKRKQTEKDRKRKKGGPADQGGLATKRKKKTQSLRGAVRRRDIARQEKQARSRAEEEKEEVSRVLEE